MTKAHAGDYTCTPYNTHGTSGTSGVMQVGSAYCWYFLNNVTELLLLLSILPQQCHWVASMLLSQRCMFGTLPRSSWGPRTSTWRASARKWRSRAVRLEVQPPRSLGDDRMASTCPRRDTRSTRAPSPSLDCRRRTMGSTSVWWVPLRSDFCPKFATKLTHNGAFSSSGHTLLWD